MESKLHVLFANNFCHWAISRIDNIYKVRYLWKLSSEGQIALRTQQKDCTAAVTRSLNFRDAAYNF